MSFQSDVIYVTKDDRAVCARLHLDCLAGFALQVSTLLYL